MSLDTRQILLGKQNGIALLMLMFLLVFVAITGFVSQLNSSNFEIEVHKKTSLALAEAKLALIGYMLKRQHPERPGDLPCPDRTTDKNYDGTQDSPCSSSRLGKFPWRNVDDKGNFVDGVFLDLRDGNGERLWFVVSRNLVDPTNVPTIDRTIVSSPKYPWLSVYDHNGVLLTNRAVALIISPGKPMAYQDRSADLPAANQFLETVTRNAVKYTNSSSASTKFISGQLYDQFGNLLANDEITFLTIDEIMPLIEKVI